MSGEWYNIMKATDGPVDSLYPWTEYPVAKAVQSWERMRDNAENYLMEDGIDATIDEIALMFKSERAAMRFIGDAVRSEGVELFNSAHDRVETWPFGSTYCVNYWFLRMPSSMRLEVMVLGSGHSPVHEALAVHLDDNMPVVAHLSFKKPDAEKYSLVYDAMDLSDSLTHVQSCDSTYGKFSYWHHPGLPVYVKPRVNVRDQGNLIMDDPDDDNVIPFGTGTGHPTIGGMF